MTRFSWTSPETVLLIAGLLCAAVARFGRRRSQEIRSVLDTILLHWTKLDPFTIRDLLNGGVAVFGRTGSGKTSSSGKLLARQIVQYGRSGGLILAAKPEDRAYWQAIFTMAGRSADLSVFSPAEPLRFNFLDYEMRHGGHTRNIVNCLMTIAETLRLGRSSGGSDEPFWPQQNERMFHATVEIVKLATGRVTAPDLQQFILGAAVDPSELESPKWQADFHCQLLNAAHQATKSSVEEHDFQLAVDYWLSEVPRMGERMRTSILAGVMGLLHVFNTGIVRELVSGETNFSPDHMLSGKWLLVDMAPTEYGELGRFVCAGWKYLTQRRLLRRAAQSDDTIHVIWCDEAHQFVNSFDSAYIAQSRSHLGCMVFLSQSLPGYYAAFPGASGKDDVLSLLANFGHTIVHASDAETAEWAAKSLGMRKETLFSGSAGPPTDSYDQLLGESHATSSFSEHYEKVLQDSVFMNGLRTGGEINGRQADAIVLRFGQPFSTGDNHLFRTFSQE
jgi:hypothetical protein